MIGWKSTCALWPLQPIDGHVYFQPWQIITYAFLHDTHNILHILFNMWQLWMFGAEIERYVGPRRLLACYFASVVTAAVAQLVVPMISARRPAPCSALRAAYLVCCWRTQ